jgi:hypothetical protein
MRFFWSMIAVRRAGGPSLTPVAHRVDHRVLHRDAARVRTSTVSVAAPLVSAARAVNIAKKDRHRFSLANSTRGRAAPRHLPENR